MTKWDRLIAARRRKHFSQLEAAAEVNVGLVTYQRWEAGKVKPQPQHLRQLYAVFDTLLDQNEQDMFSSEPVSLTPLSASGGRETPKNRCLNVSGEEIDRPQVFITTHMITYLWSLAFMDHPTCTEKRDAIRQAIKEFDTMNTNHQNYQITRREALCSLATLPMITLGLTTSGKEVLPAQYGSVVSQCAASLEACWEMYRSGDASDTSLAFQSAAKYVSVLQMIVKDSSFYHKEALDLAARYALLKTLLGWICVGPTDTIQYAQEAVTLSNETGDISLQLSAYSKLAWAYFYNKKYPLALTTAQKAEMLLLHYNRLSNTPSLHPCVQGGTYSTLGLMQSKNGISPVSALGKASATDPGDECYAFMDFKRSSLLLEAGWAYCSYGNQAKVMETLSRRIDPETLAPKIAQSAMGRIGAINLLALSSLKTKDRDVEQTIHFWVAGIEGAKVLKHEQRFQDALATYELMEVVWPDDASIRNLRDHIVHWE